MNGVAETDLMEQGRTAAATADWPRAFDLLVRPNQHSRLTIDELGLLVRRRFDLVEGGAASGDLLDDVFGGGFSDEGFGVVELPI